VLCPFREVTGLPCPLCGGTRAFSLAVQGDPDFLEFGAVWVFVAVATAVALIARLRIPWRAWPAAAAVAWAWALAHRDTIVPESAG